MSANLLTLNSSKTEFLIIGLKKQLSKIDKLVTQYQSLFSLHATLALFLTNVLPSPIRSLHFIQSPDILISEVRCIR